MSRKKLDNRIRILIENGINTGHRGFVMLLGEEAREQVVILHHMLRKASVKSQPKVLWCYKKELDFADSRNKRRKKLAKKIQQGKLNPETENPFDQFIASTEIRFCYYKDTHKILGNTFGMCVLQDFEALTPNLLARTIETVEGGGLVVLLVNSVKSRRALFTLSMDVHSRYRTESHHQVIPRFNERFILSLSNNKRSILLDDKLNVIPHSSHIKTLVPIPRPEENNSLNDLRLIKSSLQDTQPAGSLVNLCLTTDQAKGLIRFIDAIAEKTLKRTVSLTAARGRGKSAALGLAMSAAVGFGYSNIFVTSPSPENLGTLFDFVFKGFDAMGYEEHTDYELIKSTNPEFSNAVVRVNVFKDHRQTIQYIHPKDSHRLGQAELMVIDEAAAIPLPLVKALLGPYLVFMASTINGYEGTGRSLSLKLLEQLRKQSSGGGEGTMLGRTLTEVTLDESIRYSKGDPTESWLNKILCLDSTVVPPLSTGCPLPADCELFYVNRDTLFSFNDVTEAFLQRIMSMFVAAHYKNSPNDLQMLSDAPAHHLFVLLGPKISGNALPEVFSVIQVCLEGEISRSSIMDGLSQGKRPHGDLIPWSMATQYQDDNFPSLSGARIVRIATHPDYQRMGYGRRAMELLQRYYEHSFVDLNESKKVVSEKDGVINTVTDEDVSFTEEVIKPRKNLPPLFYKLSERPAENLDYIGVSFGLTKELLKFWKKVGFTPTYLRQTKNDLTGEHSMIMLKTLQKEISSTWLKEFWTDFRRRFINLVGLKSMDFHPELLISLLDNQNQESDACKRELKVSDLDNFVTPYDLKRLELYAKNMADYHLIVDLLPSLARLFFLYRLDNFKLSAMQKVILVGMGLQNKTVDDLVTDLELVGTQIMGLFNKMIRKLMNALNETREKDLTRSLLSKKTNGQLNVMKPVDESMDVELERAAQELKRTQKEQLDSLKNSDIGQYAIKGSDKEWESALSGKGSKGLISVKSGEKRVLNDSNQDVDSLVESIKPKKKKKKNK
ncbi:RNA cytidine acetyltransferase [Lepeophtheirus salmonis]|nr:RNA cytidine acetyltransferase-like [Lepeophtheirus salmonis]